MTSAARTTPDAGDDPARDLLDRVRALLPDRRLREVRMFGVVALMVDDAMAVAAHKDGSLLVRVDPAEGEQLLDQPYASQAEMGNGRSMGDGWIRVGAEGLRSAAALGAWVDAATRHPAHHRATA